MKHVVSFIRNPVGYLVNLWATIDDHIPGGRPLWYTNALVGAAEAVCARDGVQDDVLFSLWTVKRPEVKYIIQARHMPGFASLSPYPPKWDDAAPAKPVKTYPHYGEAVFVMENYIAEDIKDGIPYSEYRVVQVKE